MSQIGDYKNTAIQQIHKQQAKTMFHDFLGIKFASDSSVILSSEQSPSSASASLPASSGGGRGPNSTTTDMGSEKQSGDHLEGIPFYGLDISNKLAGNKRSNSDSTFMGSSRDRVPQMGHDPESLRLMTMLWNGGGGDRDRTKKSKDDDILYGTQLQRSGSGSPLLHPLAGNRSIPAGTLAQYSPRGNQFAPFVPSNRLKDVSAGSTIISQSAADEGSRTGMKGSGILSSLNSGGGVSDNNSTGMPPSGKGKSGIHVLEPESSTLNRRVTTSTSRQMTIFYGGQAHVFDDVHPNKADVLMALAGSNGGSWSTSYSPKSTTRPTGDDQMLRGEHEVVAGNAAVSRQFRGRQSGIGTIGQYVSSVDRVSTPTGGHRGSTMMRPKEKEIGNEEKREA